MSKKTLDNLADHTSLQMAEHLLEQARIGLNEAAPGSIAYGQMMRAMRDYHAAVVEQKEANGKPDAMEDMTDDELVSIIEAAILAMPDMHVVRIRDAAEDRLAGNHLRVVGKRA
jgi:hypothetical protein